MGIERPDATVCDDLLYEKRDHIAFITINRPDKGNSLNAAMGRAARAIWADVRDDSWVRCAVVSAAGEKFFSTGADVEAVADAGSVSAGDGPLTEEVRWSSYQNRVWKPVVAAVNGMALGAGLHWIVDADIIVASENATFLDTHVNVGMVGAIENIGLAKRLPIGTALRMTLQGKAFRLSAERAYQLGMVDELVPLADLAATAEKIAQDIAANSPHATQLSKQAVWSSQEMSYRDSQEYGWALLRMHWAHPDFQEGPRAFAERRAPEWKDA
jgi:E-phenylitaconyl-CoA hydratase